MKITLLSILLVHTALCQRRGPWRMPRPPPRRLPPCIEEKLRSIAPSFPSYRMPEIPANIEPACNKIAPSTLEAVSQLAQSIPKPDIPTTDYFQNILLSPNPLSIVTNQIVPNQVLPNQIVPNQIVPNQIVPNQIATNQLVRAEIPRNYQVPMQNIQFLQNLRIPSPQERVPTVSVVEIPRTEKINQPFPAEPEKPCPCSSVNPFLPAASPVSPWTASKLPSVSNQSRSHHLRKIAIPPPTL